MSTRRETRANAPQAVRRRQEERSAATRAALLEAGRALFARDGYDAVSAESLVASAGLTRGALYHHFDGKAGLFDAVHEALHAELAVRIGAAADAASGPWEALVAGCVAFVDAATDPVFQRIALLDAPAVLGWERWRQVDAAHGLGLLREGLAAAVAAGVLAPRTPAGLEALAVLLSGAMNEAGLAIARAAEPEAARRETRAQLLALLGGLRGPVRG